MMAPEHRRLQSKAGYIDARPHIRHIGKILLQRTAGPYIGSIATDEIEVTRSRMSASPLKADNLHTISASPLSAITGREQVQQTAFLLDHLVGEQLQRVRHIETERPGRLQIDDELKLGRLQD